MTTTSEIRKIEDPWARAKAAQEALRAVEPKEKNARARRDAAALVLVAPFTRAAQESNEFRAAAKAEYEGYWAKTDGEKIATTKRAADQYSVANPGVPLIYHAPTISHAEYNERLETARRMREAAFTAARTAGEEILKPADVHEALGMHRNLLIRLMKRRSAVPNFPNAMEDGKKAAEELGPLSAALTTLREIRDDAIDELVAQGMQSVDIAEHLGITPARVTQIRHGGRR